MSNNTSNRKSPRNNLEYTSLIWSITIGVICFAAHIFICKGTDFDPAVVGIILLGAYIAAVTLISVYIFKYQKAKLAAEKQISANGNALRDLLAQINTPVILTDGSGKIIWHNDSFASTFSPDRASVGTSMYGFLNLTEEKLVSNTVEKNGTEFNFDGRDYNVTAFKIKAQIKSREDTHSFYLSVFDDTTDLISAKRRIERTLPVVAYIVVDNLEEIAQYVKVSSRRAANEIETILSNWAASLDGVLREYDRDRYMLLCTRENLNKCIEDKFSILDSIREIRLSDEETNMPVTVSMGIASAPAGSISSDFDLTAIERDAAAALEMALQRGGDQAAIKDENGFNFFGGRTKTLQKRTTVHARVVSAKLCSLICQANRVLVMGHKNPDFDSIGACVGITRLSMFCGVDCRIVSDIKNENFKVSTERLRANPEYANVFIDAASALDMMTPSTLLIIVDANNLSITEAPEIAANAKTVYVIDHHRKTEELPENVISPAYIDPAASSACELVSELLEQSVPVGTLNKEEANVMLSGIMVDTKNFTRSTNTRTFAAALYLRGEGANSEIARTFFNENFDEYLAEAKFGSDVVTYRGRIAITKSDGTGAPTDRVAAAKAADKLLTVRGIDASFALVSIGGNISISARSNGKINVQLILEKLGGGGHFDSAGAQISDSPMLAATSKLKEAIDEYLDSIK